MKLIVLSTIFGLLTIIISSCSDMGSSVPNSPVQRIALGQPSFQQGVVVAWFTPSTTRPEAENFIGTLGLRLTNFIQRADSTNGAFIVVPVGQEKAWVDSLETFPAIITQADRVELVPEN